jgi:hypothetical protein
LTGFLAALECVIGAADVLLQQLHAVAKHPRGDRQPLCLVAVE